MHHTAPTNGIIKDAGLAGSAFLLGVERMAVPPSSSGVSDARGMLYHEAGFTVDLSESEPDQT